MEIEKVRYYFQLSKSAQRDAFDKIKLLLSYLEKVNLLREKPENKALYALNLLDILSPLEPQISEILRLMFSYVENGKHILLNDFVNHFLVKQGLTSDKIIASTITSEENHIDVLVKGVGFAIIFENKLKGAVYQRNQLARYVNSLRQLGYADNQIFIVLLPNYFTDDYIASIPTSIWRLPRDWNKPNCQRLCRWGNTLCWCDNNKHKFTSSQLAHCDACNKSIFDTFASQTVVLHNTFADWIAQVTSKINIRESILISAMLQLSDYIKGLYETRINSQLIMSIRKYLQSELIQSETDPLKIWNILYEKFSELNELRSTIQEMMKEYSHDVINQWYLELNKEIPQLDYKPDQYFFIKIRGIEIGCWSGDYNNGKPYWGFRSDEVTDEQREVVFNILKYCQIPIKNYTKAYIAWDNTRNGAERFRKFLQAAKELGYLE